MTNGLGITSLCASRCLEGDFEDYQPGRSNGWDFGALELLMDQFNDGAIRNQERSDYCPKVYGAKTRMRTPITLSVFFPAYNEEKNIAEAIERTVAVVEDSPFIRDYEIIIINDGS